MINNNTLKAFDNREKQIKMYNDIQKDIERLKKSLNTIQQEIDVPITSV